MDIVDIVGIVSQKRKKVARGYAAPVYRMVDIAYTTDATGPGMPQPAHFWLPNSVWPFACLTYAT